MLTIGIAFGRSPPHPPPQDNDSVLDSDDDDDDYVDEIPASFVQSEAQRGKSRASVRLGPLFWPFLQACLGRSVQRPMASGTSRRCSLLQCTPRGMSRRPGTL